MGALLKAMCIAWIVGAIIITITGIVLGFLFRFFSISEWKDTLLPSSN
jgi:cytochrome b subunit of formate dehydrogenase